MSNVQIQNSRDWDAELARAKERARGLVQPERISTPGMRLTLPLTKRSRRWSLHASALLASVAIAGLSYWGVGRLCAVPSDQRVTALPAEPAPRTPVPVQLPAADDPRVPEPARPSSPATLTARSAAREPRLRDAPTKRVIETLERSSPRLAPALAVLAPVTTLHLAPVLAPRVQLLAAATPQPQAPSAPAHANLAATPSASPVPSGPVSIDDLQVRGSLATSAVRRALERIRPQFTQCYLRADAAARRGSLRVEASIDEVGRVRDPRAQGEPDASLARCVAAATRRLVAEPPDTGTVTVSWQLRQAP